MKVGKRPINEGKRPISANGQFFGHPAMVPHYRGAEKAPQGNKLKLGLPNLDSGFVIFMTVAFALLFAPSFELVCSFLRPTAFRTTAVGNF